MRHTLVGRTLLASAATLAIALSNGALGAGAAAAGNSQNGCKDQWLFNGVWRAEVTKVAPHMDDGKQTGWEVTQVWRNGTKQEIAPINSFVVDETLELTSGQIVASSTTRGTLSFQTVAYHDFAQAAELTYTQLFLDPNVDPNDKPKSVDISFDAGELATHTDEPQFSTHQYDFRFDLNCVATGAAAQAQGGSNQVSAIAGCRNQWLSNGLWKMRARTVSPDDDDAGPQIGWLVAEDWVALVNSSSAGDTGMGDQFLITTSGDDVASSNSTVATLTWQRLAYHEFAPGGGFSYSQNFRWAPFDPTDKPVRLLVTFDSVAQNKRDGVPHYKGLADFRIDLTCTK
ncbi:MAG TPA: hypothetical protein VID24_08520 [Candidatus Eremiobacteraceae bacterium]|jgi:hypothetical protein